MSPGSTERVAAGVVVLWLFSAAVAAAQSPPLAEVARREQERRKTAPQATKVLTNKDLPKVVSPPPTPPAPAEAAPVTPEATAVAQPVPDDRDKPKDEAWWRARIAEPRTQLHRDEVLVDALQARVNGLTSDFVGRDDPYQRARIGDDRQKAIAEMERLRTEIVELKQQIAGIEEEARKASVPPGWLR